MYNQSIFFYLLLNKKECDIVDPVLNLGYDIPFIYFVPVYGKHI